MTHIPSLSTLRVSYLRLQPSSYDAVEQLRSALESSLVQQSSLQKNWRKLLAG